MADIKQIREHIVSRLRNELSPLLTYHNLAHTLDVETQCSIIAKEEGITDDKTLLELQLAALYHDSGFIYVHKGHEQKSCEIAKNDLRDFGLSESVISNVCDLILATEVPQMPKNIAQQIICDADLDYLGRGDYFIINENLHREFLEFAIICDEAIWEASRISFLQSHAYFTKYSQLKRTRKKLEHLNYLISMKEVP